MILFPIEVHQHIKDWKSYLMERLVGAHTLPVDFHVKVTALANYYSIDTISFSLISS